MAFIPRPLAPAFWAKPIAAFALCVLSHRTDGAGLALSELQKEWPKAHFIERPDLTGPLVERIFSTTDSNDIAPLHLLVKGTNFQVQVWQALLAIPARHAMVTYQDVGQQNRLAHSHPGRCRSHRQKPGRLYHSLPPRHQ